MRARLQSVESFTLFEIDNELHYCRKIPEHPGYYASTQGDIISAKSDEPKIISAYDNGTGYRKVSLYVAGSDVQRRVHRLVAAAFLQRPEADRNGSERTDVNHLDSDRANNKLSNLEYASRSENLLHGHMMAKVRNAQT